MIADINAGDSTGWADIFILNDAAYGLIATAINAVSSTDCAEDAAGKEIDAISDGNLMDCADITVSDDATDELIATTVDSGNSTDSAEHAVSG